MGMHESQHAPEVVAMEVQDIMSIQCVIGPHQDKQIIINMDQTPVYFSMDATKTLELIGCSTVPVQKSTTNTKCVTVAMMICANGTILLAVHIFKGKPNGRIECTEFETFPDDHFYCCQENAWMDEAMMFFGSMP